MAPPPPRRPTPRRRAGGASLGAGRGARCRCRGGKRERPPGEGLEEREVWEAPDGAVFQAPDGKVFEALDPDAEGLAGVSEERFGPDVVLAVGLAEAELAGIRQMLEEIGAADILQLRAATKNSMARSLADNLTAPAAELAGPLAEGVPRAVILSGMSPAEVNELIGEIFDCGIYDVVFAAAVPGNLGTPLVDLVAEIYEDDAAASAAAAAPDAP